MIRFCVLGSGSKGNCVFVEVDGCQILLDAGLSFKAIKKRLGSVNRSVDNIHSVFITHDHTDHNKSVAMLMRLVRPHVCSGFTTGHEISRGSGTTLTSFRLSHDMPCQGFTITDSDGNKLAYVTDTGCIPEESLPHLFDCSAIIMEFNYDFKALFDGPYPLEQKNRIFSDTGHMRNDEARVIIDLVATEKLKYLLPYHISETNNRTALIEYEAGVAVKNAPGCKVVMTSQKEPTALLTVM